MVPRKQRRSRGALTLVFIAALGLLIYAGFRIVGIKQLPAIDNWLPLAGSSKAVNPTKAAVRTLNPVALATVSRGASREVAPTPLPRKTASPKIPAVVVTPSKKNGKRTPIPKIIDPASGGPETQPTVPILPTAAPAEVAQATAVPILPSPAPILTLPDNALLGILVNTVAYDVSGKPVNGCNTFDNNTPMRRMSIRVSIVNNSGQDYGAGDWGAAAYSGNEPVTLCVTNQSGQLPALKMHSIQPAQLIAYVDPNKAVTSLVMGTTSGLIARVCFEGDQEVPCPR